MRKLRTAKRTHLKFVATLHCVEPSYLAASGTQCGMVRIASAVKPHWKGEQMNGNGSMLGFVIIVTLLRYWYVVAAVLIGLGVLGGIVIS